MLSDVLPPAPLYARNSWPPFGRLRRRCSRSLSSANWSHSAGCTARSSRELPSRGEGRGVRRVLQFGLGGHHPADVHGKGHHADDEDHEKCRQRSDGSLATLIRMSIQPHTFSPTRRRPCRRSLPRILSGEDHIWRIMVMLCTILVLAGMKAASTRRWWRRGWRLGP